MSFLVDTNILSEFRRGPWGNPGVHAWARSVAESDLLVSVITIKEIEYGILKRARKDPAQSLIFRAWLDNVILPQFAGRVLDIDIAVALAAAGLDVPDRRPTADGLIAATALVHDLTVVTGNESHFRPMGVRLLNPFT